MSTKPVIFGLPPVPPVILPIETSGAPIIGQNSITDQSAARGAQHPIEPEEKRIDYGQGGENVHEDFRGVEAIQTETFAVDASVVTDAETATASLQLTKTATYRDRAGHTGLPRAEGLGYLQFPDRTFPGEVTDTTLVDGIEYLLVDRKYFSGDPPVYTDPAAWADEAEYLSNDLVTSGGNLYQARVDHTASSLNEPPTSAFWKLVEEEVTVTVIAPGDVTASSYAVGDHVLVHAIGDEYACVSTADVLVKVTATDSTAGVLNDEITAGDTIITTVVGGAGVDQKLEIAHGNPGDLINVHGQMVSNPIGGNGITIVGAAPATDPYIKYNEAQDNTDDLLHSRVSTDGAEKFIVLPANTDENVKVNAADPAAGKLEDKITVNRAGVSILDWLHQATVANQVALSHATLAETGGDNFLTESLVTGLDPDETNFAAGAAAAGFCSFEVDEIDLDQDAAGHCEYKTIVTTPVTYRWLALPTDAETDETIKWDGDKYIPTEGIPDRPETGDYVLTSQDGVMSWVEMSTFVCP